MRTSSFRVWPGLLAIVAVYHFGDAMQAHLQHAPATFDFCVQLRREGDIEVPGLQGDRRQFGGQLSMNFRMTPLSSLYRNRRMLTGFIGGDYRWLIDDGVGGPLLALDPEHGPPHQLRVLDGRRADDGVDVDGVRQWRAYSLTAPTRADGCRH